MMAKKIERVYALARCGDGRWLLLNRRYQPFGIGASPHARYDYQLCDGIRVWLRERDLKLLDSGSRRYRSGDAIVWLFHDATNPRISGACKRAYERRIAILDLFPIEGAA